jgi:hypothetical protein
MEFMGSPTKDAYQANVLMDMHLYNLSFCRETHFDAKKTSTFFSIMKRVLEVDCNTNLESASTSFQNFKTLVLAHACERPPAR